MQTITWGFAAVRQSIPASDAADNCGCWRPRRQRRATAQQFDGSSFTTRHAIAQAQINNAYFQPTALMNRPYTATRVSRIFVSKVAISNSGAQ